MVTVKSSRLPTHNWAYALLMKKDFFVDSSQMLRFVNCGEKQVSVHVTWKEKGLTQCTSTTELCLPAWALWRRTGWARFIVHPGPEAEQTW